MSDTPDAPARSKRYVAAFLALLLVASVAGTLAITGVVKVGGPVEVIKVVGPDGEGVMPAYLHEMVLTLEGSAQNIDTFVSEISVVVNEPGIDVVMPLSDDARVDGDQLTIPLPVLQPGAYKLVSGRYSLPFFSSKEATVELGASADDCFKAKTPNACLSVYFHRKVFRDVDARPALEELLSLTERKPETLYACHEWSHAIGEAAAWKFRTFEKAMENTFDVCHFGFYHGVQEGIASVMTTAELKAALPVQCDLFTAGQTYGDCAHGLGHVTYWRAGGDYYRAVDLCATLLELPDPDKYLAIACVTGVTMSWSDDYKLDRQIFGKPIHMKPVFEDTFDLCKSLSERHLRAGCYEYINPTQMVTTEQLLAQIPKCNALTDDLESKWCWLGFARDAAWQPSLTTAKMVDICQQARDTSFMWFCFDNVVHSKTVTTHKRGTAKEICTLLPKSIDPSGYESRCQSLQNLEDERFNAEGRDTEGNREGALPTDQGSKSSG